VSFKIFHPKRHTWKNNNQIAKNGNFEPLFLGNPLWSRQSADVGFLYGSISITIYGRISGAWTFFFCNTVLCFEKLENLRRWLRPALHINTRFVYSNSHFIISDACAPKLNTADMQTVYGCFLKLYERKYWIVLVDSSPIFQRFHPIMRRLIHRSVFMLLLFVSSSSCLSVPLLPSPLLSVCLSVCNLRNIHYTKYSCNNEAYFCNDKNSLSL